MLRAAAAGAASSSDPRAAAADSAGAAAPLRLVSGHDTTLMPLLLALGVYDERWPPFCATLCVELWLHSPPPLRRGEPLPPQQAGGGAEEEGKGAAAYVRLLYNGRTARDVASAGGAFYEATAEDGGEEEAARAGQEAPLALVPLEAFLRSVASLELAPSAYSAACAAVVAEQPREKAAAGSTAGGSNF